MATAIKLQFLDEEITDCIAEIYYRMAAEKQVEIQNRNERIIENTESFEFQSEAFGIEF